MGQLSETLTGKTIGGLPILSPNEYRRPLNLLVYGEPGVGKTVLAASADEIPELRKVLILDVEGGTMSVDHRFPNVSVVRLTDFLKTNDIYDELWRRKDHDFGCIVLDSLSEMQKLSMSSIMHGEVYRNPEIDPDIPSMRNWGKNINQIRRLVRQFRDLPIPTIFTALVSEDKDDRTGRLLRKPALSGKLASEVAGFFDIVGFLYIKEAEGQQTRFMLTGGAEGIVAKDRSERLPPILESPTMKVIYDLVTKGNKD